MKTHRALRVVRADRGGSSWPVLVETDAGVFYTKLRGAAQAPASLVAETIVGALAEKVGLRVPERALIDIPADVPSEDRHQELVHLLGRSTGLNLGFAQLPAVRRFIPADVERVEEELASKIVWFDGLVQNPDRTAKNPNLLWSQQELWLIDHGACLGFQHDWTRVTEDSPRQHGSHMSDHVLASRATLVEALDNALASRLSRSTLQSAIDVIQDEFLDGDAGARSRRRAAYVAFLWKRLKKPRPFVVPTGPSLLR